MKVCIITLGCKVNQYESNQIAAKYLSDGHEVVVNFVADADLYIVNTCAVTSFAEKKSRYQVSRINNARRRTGIERPARIVVCGCSGDRTVNESLTCHALQPRNRAFIKVQDGCNNFCSYCIVPHIRGRSRSRNIPDIITEIKNVNKPVVLTGIDLSSFGLDNDSNLCELCNAVNDCGLPFELSSMEVGVISNEFLQELESCPNFLPKFHVPLQSASDKILKSMNRKYTSAQYREKINLIRKYFPNAIITTDVIIGFPTETEEDFTITKNFIAEMNFAKVHIFPYSKRTGTTAAKLGELQSLIISDRIAQINKCL